MVNRPKKIILLSSASHLSLTYIIRIRSEDSLRKEIDEKMMTTTIMIRVEAILMIMITGMDTAMEMDTAMGMDTVTGMDMVTANL